MLLRIWHILTFTLIILLCAPANSQHDQNFGEHLRYMSTLFNEEDIRKPADTYSMQEKEAKAFTRELVYETGYNYNYNTSVNKILVIVEADLWAVLMDLYAQYAEDIHTAYGCAVFIEACSGMNHVDIKLLILEYSENLDGVVLIGDMPAAWFETENDFDRYGHAEWPCDLYYMDLDGFWEDTDQDGIYNIHSGDQGPEIFVGRISTAHMGTLQDEYQGMIDYFYKDHVFWLGISKVNHQYSLAYTCEDWENINYFSDDIDAIYGADKAESYRETYDPFFGANDYKNRLLNDRYEFIQLAAHSSYMSHSIAGGHAYAYEIFNSGTEAIAYNLFCCSACRWTSVSAGSTSGFLGGAYVYNKNHSGLVLVGSTKTGSMLSFYDFYHELGRGETFGDALEYWWNRNCGDSHYNSIIYWFYGLSIIGDPLVNLQYCVQTDQLLDLGPDLQICEGTTTSLTVGPGYEACYWSNGMTTPVIEIGSACSLSAYAKNNAGCWFRSDTINIGINPLPVADAGADTSLCEGELLTLTATGGTQYEWDHGIMNGVPFTVEESATYEVTVRDANGCEDTDVVHVEALPKPVVDLGNDAIICEGSSIMLDAGADAGSYSWSDGYTGQTREIDFETTLSVIVTGINGCASIADTISIGITPRPVVELGNDTTICEGSSLILDAGADAASYTWSDGYSDQTRVIDSETTLSVMVTGINGCVSIPDTISVTIAPRPVVDLGNDTIICEGTSIILDGGTGASGYSWSDGSQDQIREIDAAMTLSLIVTGTNGCNSLPDTISIELAPLPVINLGNDINLYTNQSIMLDAGPGYAEYLWSTDETEQTITVDGSWGTGTYQVWVVVTDVFGCSDSDVITITIIEVPISLCDIDQDPGISIFPNPNDGIFTLSTGNALFNPVRIDIYNAYGSVVFTDFMQDRQSREIDLQGQAKGFYILRITADGLNYYQKLIVR